MFCWCIFRLIKDILLSRRLHLTTFCFCRHFKRRRFNLTVFRFLTFRTIPKFAYTYILSTRFYRIVNIDENAHKQSHHLSIVIPSTRPRRLPECSVTTRRIRLKCAPPSSERPTYYIVTGIGKRCSPIFSTFQ